MKIKNINFPTFLTILRLVISPLVLPILLVNYLPQNDITTNFWLAVIFVMISLTDFLDGYLARVYKQETLLGKLLDPIADKFLLYSTLIALVVTGKLYYFWAIIFIGREFFIMGLREIAASYGLSIDVSAMGKLKTAAQMLFLTIAILNNGDFNIIQNCLLFISLFLSLISAGEYYLVFSKKIRDNNDI